MKSDILNFNLRLPREIHKVLLALAAKNRRSIHSEILHVFDCHLQLYGSAHSRRDNSRGHKGSRHGPNGVDLRQSGKRHGAEMGEVSS